MKCSTELYNDIQLVNSLQLIANNFIICVEDQDTINKPENLKLYNTIMENLVELTRNVMDTIHNTDIADNTDDSTDKEYYVSSDRGNSWEKTTETIYNSFVCESVIGKVVDV